MSSATVLTAAEDRLARVRAWYFDELPDPTGRLSVWEEPKHGRQYVAGSDHALGIGRDYDAAVVLDRTANPVRQVAELHGHWGEQFDRVLFALLSWYNDAFLVGERQFGLPILQRLVRVYGFTNLYRERDEDQQTRMVTYKLGYWRGELFRDVTIPNLRRALRDRKIELRSHDTIDQLSRLQYKPRSEAQDIETAEDKHMGLKLQGGGSPDLVMATAYAWHACNEVPRFEADDQFYPTGSLGQILGGPESPEPKPVRDDRKTERKKRRARRRGQDGTV